MILRAFYRYIYMDYREHFVLCPGALIIDKLNECDETEHRGKPITGVKGGYF